MTDSQYLCQTPNYTDKSYQPLDDGYFSELPLRCRSACGDSLPRCPDGNKVSRTKILRPERRFDQTSAAFDGKTSYSLAFTTKLGVEKAASYRPRPRYLGSNGISETKSCYQSDYTPHVIEPYKPHNWSRHNFFKRQSNAMEGLTTYRLNYDVKAGPPAPSYKPKSFLHKDKPLFDARTTYGMMFQAWCLPCTKSYKPEDRFRMDNCTVCAPFRGMTMYKQDYRGERGNPAKTVKKEAKAAKMTGKFDSVSVYRKDFENFYYDEADCVPAGVYDHLNPRQDCRLVECFEPPVYTVDTSIPVPPCSPGLQKKSIPTHEEVLCGPKSCVYPYRLNVKENSPEKTEIVVEHNDPPQELSGQGVTVDNRSRN